MDREASNERVGRALHLLANAHEAWRGASGVVHVWHDGALLEEGRRRFHARSSTNQPVLPPVPSQPFEAVHTFWATNTPWRVRLDLRRTTFPVQTEATAWDSLVVHGLMHHQTWWTCRGADVTTNAGDTHVQYGVEDLDVLLRPDTVAQGFVVQAASEVEAGERPALRLEATPVAPPETFFRAVPGLVALGATDYALTVDGATGILLGVEAYIQGHLARRTVLTDLSIDPPIATAVFDPPVAPAYVGV